MTPAIESIFLAALELDDPGDRRVLIDRRIAELDDTIDANAVRKSVLEMIEADEAACEGDFLGRAFFGPSDSEHDATSIPKDSVSNDSRFEVIAKHRQGGLGEVWIAHDRQLRRDVAIKQIKPDWKNHDEARGRFIREAEVTGRLEHPGIVPVYAMGTWEDGSHYYAMRFIEGRTLREVIEAAYHNETEPEETDAPNVPPDRLSLRRLLACFVDVCNTMGYAHSRGILHRDIKPANIMVGPYGETLIVDWGLAKRLDDSPIEGTSFEQELSIAASSVDAGHFAGDHPLAQSMGGFLGDSSRTRLGGRVGTPQYMSPEQAAGRVNRMGIRTDVYLLGATLYEALTGLPPHRGDSVDEVVEQIQKQPPPRPRDVRPTIPAPLEAICLAAMAMDPMDRYSSAQAIASDVENWMADQPVSVYHETRTERSSRWIRNHRALATSAFVATILLAVGSIVGTLFYNTVQNDRRQADLDRAAKAAELIAQQEKRRTEAAQRVTELKTMAQRADVFSLQEIRDSRFDSALSVVSDTVDSIGEGNEFPELVLRLDRRRKQLTRIVEFYRLAEICERKNIQSRDIHAITACIAGLKALGVYDKADWWNHLPADDLNPKQIDHLQWDVYQQWMLMDAMLLKMIGIRLAGDDAMVRSTSLLSSFRRFNRTDLGKSEATAAIMVSDRLDGFRLSEAGRWYRKGAEFRLGWGARLQGSDLGDPTSAVDAQSLGILCLISHLDPKFKLFFRDYRGDDPLATGLELFEHASSLRPDHYWSQMCLAQMQYLAATQDNIPREIADNHLESAFRACERCITLRPNQPYAYSDRSSVARTRAQRILEDESIPPRRRVSMAQSLYQLSLDDSQTADQILDAQPWVGWQSGLALQAAGRPVAAVERWWKAAFQKFVLVESDGTALIGDDDLRGRAEVAAKMEQSLDGNSPNQPRQLDRSGLLAAIYLNQGRFEEAAEIMASWPEFKELSARMQWLLIASDLHDRKYEAAQSKISQVNFDLVRDSVTECLLRYGQAMCSEASGDFSEAKFRFRRALKLATTDDHQTAQYLGLARCLAMQGDDVEAFKMLEKAIEIDPALEVRAALVPVAKAYQHLKLLAAKTPAESDEKLIVGENRMPTEVLASVKRFMTKALERAKRPIVDLGFDWNSGDLPALPPRACVMDSGFELQSPRYWGTWQHVASPQPETKTSSSTASHPSYATNSSVLSSAIWSDDNAAEGLVCLRIAGEDPGESSERANAWGRLSQTISIVPDQLYQVRILCRCESADAGAVKIRIDDQTVIQSPQGDAPWEPLIGFYQAAVASDAPNARFVPAQVSIECWGAGRVWLDDLSLIAIDPGPQKPRQRKISEKE